MISDKPYRKALTMEEAVDELKRSSGTQFDPEVVAAFLQFITAKGRTQPKPNEDGFKLKNPYIHNKAEGSAAVPT